MAEVRYDCLNPRFAGRHQGKLATLRRAPAGCCLPSRGGQRWEDVSNGLSSDTPVVAGAVGRLLVDGIYFFPFGILFFHLISIPFFVFYYFGFTTNSNSARQTAENKMLIAKMWDAAICNSVLAHLFSIKCGDFSRWFHDKWVDVSRNLAPMLNEKC